MRRLPGLGGEAAAAFRRGNRGETRVRWERKSPAFAPGQFIATDREENRRGRKWATVERDDRPMEGGMVDQSTERPLFIAPSAIRVLRSEDQKQVWMALIGPHPTLGFRPELALAVELSPAEALDLASRLESVARAAGGEPSQL